MDFLQIKSEKLWGKNLVYTDDVPWEASIYLLTFLSQIKKVKKAAFERKPFVGHKNN